MQTSNAEKTILLADDSAIALLLLSRRFTAAGYRVVTASDGIEAAQRAYSEAPDLIVLDITMPRMNGYHVCRLLKRDAAVAHIPVIILSAADERGTEFWSLRTGADAFMTKTANPTDLLPTVERLLAQSALRASSHAASAPPPEQRPAPGPEEILSKVCTLMDEELYATTIQRIELKTIQQSLRDGVLTLDLSHQVTAANQALCLMLGVEEEELLGKDCLVALGESLGACTQEVLEGAIAGNGGEGQDAEIRSRSGETIPVAISALPLRDYLGVMVGGVCLFQDITRRKEVEMLYEQMRALDKVKNDLTHMIVHDLRTPLTSLLTGLMTLQGSPSLNEMENELLTISVSGGHTLLGMINDLLDISKMEDGSLSLEKSSVSLSEITQEAFQQVNSLVEEKMLTLQAQIPPEISAGMPPASLLCADADKIRRVLVNLLGNAIKFTPRSGLITVSASLSPDQESVVVSVRDTGEGIPREAFARIFEKFGQVETRTAGRTMSTGLGLTFCKLVVEAHGGRIWVESERGEGSTFFFTLPTTTAS
jgi:PAS domain S-box-containing protein